MPKEDKRCDRFQVIVEELRRRAGGGCHHADPSGAHVCTSDWDHPGLMCNHCFLLAVMSLLEDIQKIDRTLWEAVQVAWEQEQELMLRGMLPKGDVQ